MPSPISASYLATRKTDGISMAQMHDLVKSEDRVNEIIAQFNELIDLAKKERQLADADKAALDRQADTLRKHFEEREAAFGVEQERVKVDLVEKNLDLAKRAEAAMDRDRALILQEEDLVTRRTACEKELADKKALQDEEHAAQNRQAARLADRQREATREDQRLTAWNEQLAEKAEELSECRAALTDKENRLRVALGPVD